MIKAVDIWLPFSSTLPGHGLTLYLCLHCTHLGGFRGFECQSKNQRKPLVEGAASRDPDILKICSSLRWAWDVSLQLPIPVSSNPLNQHN